MEQLVTVPSGNTQLSFFYELPALNAASGASDFMNVRMDGDLLFSVDATSTAFIGYVQETISLAAYADGGNHTLRFESGITGALGAVAVEHCTDLRLVLHGWRSRVCCTIQAT